jgi:hypothetical protein
MSRLIACLTVALLVWISGVCGAGTPSNTSLHAATILADVRAQGARAVVANLSSDTATWNRLVANVGRGNQEWLKVAAALRPGTDAGASEALDEAIFLSLKASPAAVLQLMKDGVFETTMVCSSNIGIDYSPAQSRRFIRERIQAVNRVTDPNLAAVREHCAMGLRAALADFDGAKGERKPQ